MKYVIGFFIFCILFSVGLLITFGVFQKENTYQITTISGEAVVYYGYCTSVYHDNMDGFEARCHSSDGTKYQAMVVSLERIDD